MSREQIIKPSGNQNYCCENLARNFCEKLENAESGMIFGSKLSACRMKKLIFMLKRLQILSRLVQQLKLRLE